MYQFKADIPAEEFEAFIENSSFAPIQQTTAWSKLKNNWESAFCGIYRDDGTMAGAALILMRKLMPGFVYAYCPRGPIMDLCDREALEAFTKGAAEFCRKNGVYLLKTDPAVIVGKTLPDMPPERYFDPFDLDRGKREFEALTGCGFIHKGFGKNLEDATQPRFNAVIPLKDAEGNPLDAAKLKKNYKTKIRKYLGSFQPARGLFYEEAGHSQENIALFKKILSATEERQSIFLRNEQYFKLLADSFGDKAFFAFEKCKVDDYIANLDARYEKEPENREKLTEQKEEALRVKEQRGETVELAALLTVYPPNKTGVKTAEYLYAGADLSVFPSFCATLCGLCAQCLLCIEKGCDFLNLGGVSGYFNDGLYDFKSPFNPIIVEYAGEFDLPVNKAKYALMEKGLPVLKKGYSKLRRLLKK